jgi:hypothetical protein
MEEHHPLLFLVLLLYIKFVQALVEEFDLFELDFPTAKFPQNIDFIQSHPLILPDV